MPEQSEKDDLAGNWNDNEKMIHFIVFAFVVFKSLLACVHGASVNFREQ